MLQITEKQLHAECQKLIKKHERYMRELRKEDVRRKRRGTVPSTGQIHRPSYWSLDKGFDPYHVRSNRKSIVYAVNKALKNGRYEPRSPIAHDVPKAGGEIRVVSIFQIVDSVVSREVFRSLSDKNKALMSARSYAYRDDLSAHDAIQYIASEFKTDDRLYIAEFDFSKYFDSISHDHIQETITKNGFLITKAEQRIVNAFLKASPISELNYNLISDPEIRTAGIPQGTSLSLFLANIAAWQLDRSLERIGVGFARYADDTLVWSRDYVHISTAVNILKRESVAMGARLNPKKSKGVRLFVPAGEKSEISSTDTIEFVGYRFSRGAIGFNGAVEQRIKNRIEHLTWSNLLQALQQGGFQQERISQPIDRDYIVLLMQIRRYLYGNYSESKVRSLERGAVKRLRFPGVLSYFPLATDTSQMVSLDGWLSGTLHQAMKKRAELLQSRGIVDLPYPHGLSKSELIAAMGVTSRGIEVDLRIPSIRRFISVLNRTVEMYGANSIGRGVGAEQYQYSIGLIEG